MSGDVDDSVDKMPPGWDTKQQERQASFLQSGQWAAFQRKLGNEVHFQSGGGWSCLLIERRTPLGRYLFAPYGPTLQKAGDLPVAVEKIRLYAKQLGFDWLTFEPMIEGGSYSLREQLVELGAKPSSHLREPDMTRLVNLSLSEADLLASISQSTRSYIRKNQRESLLAFKSSAEPKDMVLFVKMLATVTDRNNVNFFPDEYFFTQAELLMPAGMLRLEIALKDKLPVASALFHDYGQTSSYTYAASLPEARGLNASALLLWQTMLNAKARGIKQMDLFGVAPPDAPGGHPWQGFSSFKKKFGGQEISFAGTWDLPLSPKYRAYRLTQRLRASIR